jgi:hypothetical protein
MSNSRVPAIFQAFLNQKVEVIECKRKMKIGGKERTFDDSRIAPSDTTIKALQNVVAQQGMSLRVFLPGMFGTDDLGPNRLNAYVNKRNGDWKITRLRIG